VLQLCSHDVIGQPSDHTSKGASLPLNKQIAAKLGISAFTVKIWTGLVPKNYSISAKLLLQVPRMGS